MRIVSLGVGGCVAAKVGCCVQRFCGLNLQTLFWSLFRCAAGVPQLLADTGFDSFLGPDAGLGNRSRKRPRNPGLPREFG